MNGTYEQDGRDVILYNYTDVEGTLHNQTVLENGVLGVSVLFCSILDTPINLTY